MVDCRDGARSSAVISTPSERRVLLPANARQRPLGTTSDRESADSGLQTAAGSFCVALTVIGVNLD